ncbi:ATP-binding protein [Novosphingobium lentum]|uniref:ATP-binding protein n=1 Tax=Novosphingobium lentum TaxID=145287 RepID=UPI00082CB487|nr:ATP-binding protein [Novosphingobium lentum]
MAAHPITPRPQPASDPAQARIAELEERVRRLDRINAALIDRVERSSDLQGSAFSMFETAISLEAMVRARTTELEEALASLNAANADLAVAHRDADAARVRLRDAIESLSDGFVLFDAQDRLVMCNKAYQGFWPEIAELSGDPPQFSEVAEAVARGQRPVGALRSPDRWVAERVARHVVANGVHIQALTDGRWVQISEIRTTEGGTVGIYTDITEVKAEDARERARELAERNVALQATLDTLSEGVCLYDAQRRLVAHNEGLERLLGLPAGQRDTIGTHERLVAYCGTLMLERADVVAWRSGSERIEAQCRLGGRQFLIRSTPIAPDGMAFSFDDVTDRLHYEETLREAAGTLERRVAERTTELEAEVAERRSVEAALLSAKTAAEHANRSKTSFLAAASHDLLQPLNAARLFVAALGERRLALPTRALVRQTGVALDSVEDLLETLFEISHLDAGAIQPEIGSIELDQLLTALRIEIAALARGKGLTLEIPETGTWVQSDVRLLRRILQNFLSNAVRYTSSGVVSVRVDDEGDHVRIAVSDTGPGIDPANLDLIFEEFRRLESDHRIPGKGLGLAIVRRASTMLGHEVLVTSVPGEGSTFAIRVPRGDAQAGTRDPVLRRAALGRLEGGVVLIIDNDDAILSGMRALLENWGHTVLVARGPGDPAAIAAAQGPLDLVIADYHLDDNARGDDAIAALRKLAGRELAGVVITADRSEEVKARIAAARFPLLNKPVKPAQLRALMRTMLSGESG